MAMAALVASTARLGSASVSITTRGPVQLQTSFKGEKVGLGPFSSPSFFSEARSPIRVSPQKLQIHAIKKIKGTVVCSSNDKTISVEVVRLYTHPKYKKRIKRSKKYHAHDEENRCKVGDIVTLVGCAPISKSKKFIVSEIIPKREGDGTAADLPPLESLTVA